MTKILEGTTALFLLISGAFYNYGYNKTALVFLCLVIVLSLITLFSIRNDINKSKKGKKKKDEINLQEFIFIDPPGYYTHPKYSYPICPHCLIDKGLISPVSKVDEDAWYCTVCDKPMSGSLGDIFTVDF